MATPYKLPPYNYCDYRCENCDEKEKCRLYKENQKRISDHYLKGEDPNDPEVFLKDLQEIFKKTTEMLKKSAAEYDIDIDKLPENEEQKINPRDFTVYQLAYQYAQESHSFIRQLQNESIPEELKDDFDDLIWYHSLIVAKTGRLVSGFADKFFDNEIRKLEEEGTISVINRGIELSRKALHHMLDRLPEHFYTINDLLELLNQLSEQLKKDMRQQNKK